MSTHRNRLPQLDGDVFLADGGIETTLVFDDGLDLPDFAAFTLLASDDGTAALDRYFRLYRELARREGVGIVLETATWRANPDWGARLGYTTGSWPTSTAARWSWWRPFAVRPRRSRSWSAAASAPAATATSSVSR